MGSTFSSLNAGLTGLYAAQRLIEVSGQNIINQNTPGYTRQRVEQKALGIGSEPSIFSGSVPQGGGVEITGERRLGDFFLDAKLRMETGRAASTKEITSGWKNVESSMDELGKKSLSNAMREFYKSWGDVNNSSDNLGARATAIGNARALVDQIKTGYTHINDLWKNGRAELDALVADLNTTMDSVLALNERIRKGTAMHANVNHLIDERDKLALHISELTGATVRKGYSVYTPENAPNASMIGKGYEDGSIEIMLAGNSMVGKNYVNHFKVDGSRDMPGIDAAPREVYQKAEKELQDKVLDAEGATIAGKVAAINDADATVKQQKQEAELRKYFSNEQAKILSQITDTTKQEAAIKEAMPNAKFEFHGHKIQKYQAFVGVYKAGDEYYEGTTKKTVAAGDKLIGKKYVAFYDVEKVMTTKKKEGTAPNDKLVPKKPEDEVLAKTRKDFSDRDFISDEGPVRLTWTVGGHNVAIEDGRIGGLVQNLKPAEVPGVSGTIGRGGCWAETGKLYNDAAANIAKEVNLIHANNLKLDKDGNPVKDAKGNFVTVPEGEVPNNTKSLVTKSTTFRVVNTSNEPEMVKNPKFDKTQPVSENNPKTIPNPKLAPKYLATLTQKEGESDDAFKLRVESLRKDLSNSPLIGAGYEVKSGEGTLNNGGTPVGATVEVGLKLKETSIEIATDANETVDKYKERVEQERVKLDKALEGTGWKVKSVKYPLGKAVVQLEFDPKASQPALKASVSIKKGETGEAFKKRIGGDATANPPVKGVADQLEETLKNNLNGTILKDKFETKSTAAAPAPGNPSAPNNKIEWRNEVGLTVEKKKPGGATEDFSLKDMKLERKIFGSDAEYDVAVQKRVRDLEKLYPGSSVTFTNEKEDGGDFFTFEAANNKLPPALRLGVAIDDPMKIAAGVYKNGVYDGSVALRIGNQQDSATSTLNEWGKSVVDVGVHASGARDSYNLAEQTRRIADQQQKSQSSVDMNEEVMNLIRGQHAYAGAARITSTVNSMLETLINLGR
ncbi:FlgK family flagellar hook-associated protein [Mobiluncus mulieris]|uniref:Flagellar hook-associated protein 1 n=1 Tax=Mobiluncus mulieris TaxID=2052 RepID=A0ABD4TVN1_9ACTO|nr:flagellar basal body rod C-terminal domain-containing protein [Mobiluncus mulieris]MCU9968010.1 flagellar biosynthesis protein FlgK [Mobiluncus mulieris]MCU9972928.1 flagellar biosynthesis protein FlgK [Mobiluncus mulieris]MCV0009104.1 flagellar biosynthesis protein FlgK [Mobiluncus mulieris]NMW74735.1 flagellar biosynthesis protein FlgK [Mobiluncus mulieris]NMX00912.1 flagellar biosynthesis protein FlgK [Mobiluncus mulieris]